MHMLIYHRRQKDQVHKQNPLEKKRRLGTINCTSDMVGRFYKICSKKKYKYSTSTARYALDNKLTFKEVFFKKKSPKTPERILKRRAPSFLKVLEIKNMERTERTEEKEYTMFSY